MAETLDPSVILAALDRVAEEMAVGTPSAAPLPYRAGVSTIEQRPAVPAPSPAAPGTAAATAAATAKSAGAKAGTAKVTAWEATTMRTAWSSGSGPAAPEARTLGTSESGASVGSVGSVGGIGSGGQGGSGQSTAARPVVAAGGPSTMATAPSRPITVGRRSPGLSRTTVAALIAIAVCVLVALLAILL